MSAGSRRPRARLLLLRRSLDLKPCTGCFRSRAALRRRVSYFRHLGPGSAPASPWPSLPSTGTGVCVLLTAMGSPGLPDFAGRRAIWARPAAPSSPAFPVRALASIAGPPAVGVLGGSVSHTRGCGAFLVAACFPLVSFAWSWRFLPKPPRASTRRRRESLHHRAPPLTEGVARAGSSSCRLQPLFGPRSSHQTACSASTSGHRVLVR